MKKILLYCFLVAFYSLHLFAQIPQSADSLASYLKSAPKDTNYVKALNDYSWLLVEQGKYNLADSLATQSQHLAIKLHFKAGEYGSLNTLGRSAYIQGMYPKALKIYEKNLQIAQKYQLPLSTLQNALANFAMINQLSGNNEKALEFSLKSIKIYENNHLPKLSGSPYDVAASVFALQGKIDLAIEYLKKTLEIKTRDQNYRGMAISANRLGNTINQKGDPKKGLVYLKQAEQYAKKVGYMQVLPDILINQSNAYRAINQPAEDIKALKKAEQISKQIHTTHQLGAIYGNMGQYYQHQKQFGLSEEYLRKALKIFEDIGSLEYQGYLYQALTEMFVDKGDFKSAFLNQKVAKQVNDSLLSEKQLANMNELNARFESEKKEQQIKLLQQDAQIKEQQLAQNKFWLAGGVLVLLLASAITAWLLNRARLQRLQETLALRNHIAADFHDELGATLSSIAIYSEIATHENGSNSQKIQPILKMIAESSRSTVTAMNDMVWSIKPDNDTMTTVVQRMKDFAIPLLENQSITFEFITNPSIESLIPDMTQRKNIYLIFKEALNNTAKYAEATHVSVHISYLNKQLQMLIRDNGKGFDTETVKRGNGLKNMQKRAQEIKGHLSIVSAPLAGTEIKLMCPLP